MLLTREDCRGLAEKILKLARADEVAVRIDSNQNCNTRYANNAVTTAGFTGDLAVTVEAIKEKKSGSATTSEITDAALARAVGQAEAIAELAPPDPEYVEPLDPQTYPEIPAFYEESANARSAQILPAVRSVIAAAEKAKVNTYGYYDITSRAEAIANKRGLFGYHRSTWADYSVTARTPDGSGSGWARQSVPRFSQLKAQRVGAIAIQKCLDSRNPRRLEPGKYTVILEPEALREMLFYLALCFGARRADEGRSFLSKPGGGNLQGEKVFGENVSLRTDPFDFRTPGRPWMGGEELLSSSYFQSIFGGKVGEWLPAVKAVWVEKGVVKNLVYDRYWAQKNQKKPGPFPAYLIMGGGGATVDDLIASTERGLLVTRFWYIRFLQSQTVQLTGLTRDGVFYIEKGKIQYPVMNFRFNESVLNVLNNIEAMTAPIPVGDDVQGEVLPAVLPTLKVRDFNFSSLSDAV